jgi:hypothetical protein
MSMMKVTSVPIRKNRQQTKRTLILGSMHLALWKPTSSACAPARPLAGHSWCPGRKSYLALPALALPLPLASVARR